MTKKVWKTPCMESQLFTPNSYVAACAGHSGNYQLVKISDIDLSAQGNVWLDTNHNNHWDGPAIDKQSWGLQNGYPNQQYIYESIYFNVNEIYRGWLQPWGQSQPTSPTPTHWFIKCYCWDAGLHQGKDYGYYLRASTEKPTIYTSNKS